MKRWIKRIIILGLILGILWIGTARLLSWQIARRLPDWAAALSVPEVNLSVHAVETGSCYTKACILVGEVHLNIIGIEPVVIRDVAIELPLRWPWRVHIMTDSEQAIILDTVIGKNQLDVNRCKGNIGGLNFAITGSIDWYLEQGQLRVQTLGLKQFAHRLMKVPKWLDFLLSDGVQTIELVPQDGYLRFWGIPLFPLK